MLLVQIMSIDDHSFRDKNPEFPIVSVSNNIFESLMFHIPIDIER